MANRVKPYIHKIILPQRSVFIVGRMIQDCIVVANETFHYIRKKKKGKHHVMAHKLDVNKAFDRVEWDFLPATFRRMGFGEVWCRWVQSCISSYEMESLLNGRSIGSIKPSRAIRPGDPMSPFYFIIVADVLSKMMNKALENNLITEIKMARSCPVVSHIFFVDDSLFFLKATSNECNARYQQ